MTGEGRRGGGAQAWDPPDFLPLPLAVSEVTPVPGVKLLKVARRSPWQSGSESED